MWVLIAGFEGHMMTMVTSLDGWAKLWHELPGVAKVCKSAHVLPKEKCMKQPCTNPLSPRNAERVTL